MRVPSALHDVLGESPTGLELVAVLLFGVGVAGWIMTGLHAATAGLPWWRLVLAGLLVTDVAAGCVANFTRSTNDFYAARPRNRWVFIAVHGHVLAVAWALGAALPVAAAVWAYTVLAAAVVNALAGRPGQIFVAGVLLAAGLVWIPQQRELAPPLVVVYCLFLVKVVYAFAVDHYRSTPRAEAPAAAVRDLGAGDREAFVAVMSAAFARDPLVVAVLGADDATGPAARRRDAFMSFMFDQNRISGGRPRGAFVDGRLVACALLEPPPASRLVGTLRMVAAALAFVPVAIRCGGRATAQLNDYVRRTRRVAPAAPHCYLAMLGVTPLAQGQGWGKRLVYDAIAQAERAPRSTGIALDTENPDNVALYTRWGFETVAIVELAGVRAVAMFRPREGCDRSASERIAAG